MPKPLPAPGRSAITSRSIARFRLARHHLLEAAPSEAVTVARDICGIQAQIMSAAYLQLWTRNHAITRADIEAALWQKRSLVKTSLMRQTIHIIPADAFPVYIAALRTSRVAGALRVMARFNIGREEAQALTALIMDALSAGPLGRAAIRAAVRPKVSRRVRAWMEKVWSIVRIPIAEGLICYGPGEDNEVTFIPVDQWLAKARPALSEEQARMDLLRAYLRAYGPATLTDFSRWSGMRASEVRPLPALLAADLEEIRVEKTVCFLLREDVDLLRVQVEGKDSVRLLPHFDPYLLAHHAKDHLVEAKHYKRVYRNQGWISPVILINGIVAGVWAYKPQGKKLQVTIEPFGRLSRAARAAIAQEAEELAGFFANQLELVI